MPTRRLNTLRGRLWVLALVGGIAVAGTGVAGLQGLRNVAGTEREADVHEEALLVVQQVETARERLRADLGRYDRRDPEMQEHLEASAELYAELLDEEDDLELPESLAAPLRELNGDARALVTRVQVAAEDPSVPMPSADSVEDLHERYLEVAEQIEVVAEEVEEVAVESRQQAERRLLAIVLMAGALLALLAGLVARAVVRSLRSVTDVAAAVTAGDLTARTGLSGGDEVQQVGRALDEMADTLQALLAEQQAESESQEFGNRLSAALEHADTAPAVLEVAGRAMDVAVPDRPVELLLSDSSQAHLKVVSVSSSGGPGCRVTSPHGCPAVRAGGAVIAESAGDLDACPRLRERAPDAAAAVCVPVTFMGRALGVLHTAGPDAGAPDPALVQRMRSLAALTGSRLGTVQALASAELQASTDLLTALCNRRTAEERLHNLHVARLPYAVALLDLDHFKTINDTYGHEAGDRALRLFATVLPDGLRDEDTAARWGGEEFLLVLPGATVEHARAVVERVRAELGAVLSRHVCPAFTVSAGVADSYSATSVEEQLALADAALLTAKRRGRDRVELAGSEDVLPLVPAQVVPTQA